MSFCIWLISLKNDDLQFHPFCCKWQDLIFSYGWLITHYIFIPHFVYSSVDIYLGLVCSLVIINRMLKYTWCNRYLIMTLYLGYILNSESYWVMQQYFNFFWRNSHIISHNGCTYFHSHQAVCKSFSSSTSLLAVATLSF